MLKAQLPLPPQPCAQVLPSWPQVLPHQPLAQVTRLLEALPKKLLRKLPVKAAEQHQAHAATKR